MDAYKKYSKGDRKKKRTGKLNGNDARKTRRDMESARISRVKTAVEAIPPYSGLSRVERVKQEKFSDLPVSEKTLDALAAADYDALTAIQALAIPQGLRGSDALIAAPTGSGKTLCFVIPVIELLWRSRWSSLDGIGAIILTPTRELAVQIFEVVTQLLKMHHITAGLVIGGKSLATEQRHIDRANILVATPGRLLQHMDESVGFSTDNLKMLVLDEADRILDLGFERTMEAILDNLSGNRQTMLFSATQTKSVKALAKLSLKDPQYIGIKQVEVNEGIAVEENSEETLSATPKKLSQFYTIIEEGDKLNVLWSFITSHLKSKILVFVTSSKQVRFFYEALRRMRPGIPLLHLFGRMKLQKRTSTYADFCKNKAACLFATDVASRGLDFPAVDWVVQVDCPESLATYIHRVGRTARYTSAGKATLFLLRSESEFVGQLNASKLPAKKMAVKRNKMLDITPKLESIVAANTDVKHLAQRAVVSYLKAVHLFADKEVFNLREIDIGKLAHSYGLPSAPRVKFPAAGGTKAIKVAKVKAQNEFGYVPRKNENDLRGKIELEQDDDEDLLQVKRTARDLLDDTNASEIPRIVGSPGRTKQKLKILSSGVTRKTEARHVQFDESEEESDPERSELPIVVAESSGDETSEGEREQNFLKRVREKLEQEDQNDIAVQKERIRGKHKKQRISSRREGDMLSMALAMNEDADGITNEAEEPSSEYSSQAEESADEAEQEYGHHEDAALKLLRSTARF